VVLAEAEDIQAVQEELEILHQQVHHREMLAETAAVQELQAVAAHLQ
tara:strand:+ start:444 stop:584 length:141 start_codon:yes stop_codon:yes gene_type:complete